MWSLKIVEGAELADKLTAVISLPVPLTRFGIGRDPGNAWPIADRTLALSARHCEIVATPRGPALRDLSTNGTFVNGQTTRMPAEHLLRDGDRVQIGPFLIAVSGPAAVDIERSVSIAAPPATPAAAPPRPVGALRGGDPAAMLAAGASGAPTGLTEILRVAPAVQDSGLDLTRIRVAPPAAARAESSASPPPAPRPAPVAAPVVPGPVAAPPSTPPSDALHALARGLGLPAAALAGHDPLALTERLAHLAVAALEGLRQLKTQEAQWRQAIGSRAAATARLPVADSVHMAPDAPAAALALLHDADPAARIHQTVAALAAHQDRLPRAGRQAMQRLAQQASPATLRASLGLPADGAVSAADEARLWQLHAGLWTGLGLPPGADWAAGFEAAALQHQAAAYDDLTP